MNPLVERLYGGPYLATEFSHVKGENWATLKQSAEVGRQQNVALFIRELADGEIRTVLTPKETKAFNAALDALKAFEVGEVRFFLFRANGAQDPAAPPKLFTAFLDQLTPDRFSDHSLRRTPVTWESFDTLLADPDGVWAQVAVSVIQGGGWVAKPPASLPADLQRRNAEQKPTAPAGASLDERLALLA